MIAPNSHITDVLDEIEEFLEGQQDVVDGSYGEPHPNKAMSLLTALQAARASETGTPSAWSAVSKRGLLRGIRHGQPTREDLAIAESDGDTIRYFYDAPQEREPKEHTGLPNGKPTDTASPASVSPTPNTTHAKEK